MIMTDRVIGNLHLNAARQLMRRVSFADVLQAATEDDSAEAGWFEDTPDFWAKHLDRRGILDVTPDQVASDARKFRELEALVRALDSLETVASFSELTNEYVESFR
jgi:nuclear pore complex protein Nup107